MRKAFINLASLFALSCAVFVVAGTPAQATTPYDSLVSTARARTLLDITYDPAYVKLAYPGGDVDPDTGVCTDVIIRSYRSAFGFDFQKAVHEDMRKNFSTYPQMWRLSGPDKNIDHRRVFNLQTYLRRQGASVGISNNPADFKPGDIVTWHLAGTMGHIGIVSDKKTKNGVPLVIHNIGAGPVEDDILFSAKMTGHFRFVPPGANVKAGTLPRLSLLN